MKFSFLLAVLKLVTCEDALRILGGRDALRDEFPFIIRLERKVVDNSSDSEVTKYRMVCSGAAVTPEWILSAAHCYKEEWLMLARFNSYFPKDMGQISPIKEVLIHPRYLDHIQTKQIDIALFRSQNIAVSQYAKISAVEYKSLIGHEVTVLGFGITNASISEKPAQVLKGMITDCPAFERYYYSSDTMLCVVSSCRIEATLCPGDSGGPVIHASGIVAVSARSINRCKDITNLNLIPGTSSGIIAMISHALDWVSNIISNMNH